MHVHTLGVYVFVLLHCSEPARVPRCRCTLGYFGGRLRRGRFGSAPGVTIGDLILHSLPLSVHGETLSGDFASRRVGLPSPESDCPCGPGPGD